VLAANGGKPVAADDPDADAVIGRIPAYRRDVQGQAEPRRVLRPIVIPEEGGKTAGSICAGLPDAAAGGEAKIQACGSSTATKPRTPAEHGRRTADLLPSTKPSLVFVHPENDLPSWHLSGTALQIVGLPEQEGAELRDYLIAHATREEEAYVHSWEPGDAVAWTTGGRCTAPLPPQALSAVMNSLQLQSRFKLGR